MEWTVMGLDPGTIKMGYGLVSVDSVSISFIEGGVLSSSKKSIGERLCDLNQGLSKLFEKHRPHHLAIEKMFLGKNPKSAFALGQAFGVSVCQAYERSCEVFEYAVRKVKKSVTGSGASSKENIAIAIKHILKIEKEIELLDESDALAVALCHAFFIQEQQRLKS